MGVDGIQACLAYKQAKNTGIKDHITLSNRLFDLSRRAAFFVPLLGLISPGAAYVHDNVGLDTCAELTLPSRHSSRQA